MRVILILPIVLASFLAGTAAWAGGEGVVQPPNAETLATDAAEVLAEAIEAAKTGAIDEALEIAMSVYSTAPSRDLRFHAALLLADLYTQTERFFRATLWLRRAFELAPDPQTKRAISLLNGKISSENPLSVSAQLSFAPSNNVNNGGKTNVIVIGGFPFSFGNSSLPLSGVEAAGSASGIYRLGQSPNFLTEATADVSFRRVWLDPASRALAPNVSDEDFEQLNFAVGLRHSWQISPGFGPTRASVGFGTGLHAGKAISTWRLLELQHIVLQSDTSSFRLGYSLRIEDRLDASINSSAASQVVGTYQYGLDNGAGVAIQLTSGEVRSDSALVDRSETSVGITVDDINIGPFDMSFSLEAAYADFSKWVLTSGGRQDRTWNAIATASYGLISYYGFSPTLIVKARQAQSNIDVFDREGLSIGLTFSSSF